MWNLESGDSESGIKLKDFTEKRLEFSTWNPECVKWNPESKTALDSLTCGECFVKVAVNRSLVGLKVSQQS